MTAWIIALIATLPVAAAIAARVARYSRDDLAQMDREFKRRWKEFNKKAS